MHELLPLTLLIGSRKAWSRAHLACQNEMLQNGWRFSMNSLIHTNTSTLLKKCTHVSMVFLRFFLRFRLNVAKGARESTAYKIDNTQVGRQL